MIVPRAVMVGSGPLVTNTALALGAKEMMLKVWPLLLARLIAPRSVQELLSQDEPLSSSPVVTLMPTPTGAACARVTSQGQAPSSSAASSSASPVRKRDCACMKDPPRVDRLRNRRFNLDARVVLIGVMRLDLGLRAGFGGRRALAVDLARQTIGDGKP